MAGPDPFPIEIRPTRAPSQRSDVDVAVTYTFRDGSIGVISFSAKGHTFEGVKERLCVHKGDCLLVMDDFHRMTIEVADRKRHYRNFYRDHGHRDNILSALDNSMGRMPYDREARAEHIADTAQLFLRTKEALESGRSVVVHPYRQAEHHRCVA